MCISNRNPDDDMRLYGNAYGVKRPGGYIEWLDPRDVIVRTLAPEPDRVLLDPGDLPVPPKIDWAKGGGNWMKEIADKARGKGA